MTPPLDRLDGGEFDIALRDADCWLELADGQRVELRSARWQAPLDPVDELMVSRCHGPSLDVGCGPGRLTAALGERGEIALGIDTSLLAVRQTRQRGATALHRDVFEPLPGEGRWHNVLLADGNIGIGGDPRALLRRIAELAAPSARVLVELSPPGTGVHGCAVRLRDRLTPGQWFRWAWLGADSVVDVAHDAGFHTAWVRKGVRWLAELER